MSGPLARVREAYARHIAWTAGVADERLIAAFASVERERFLGPGPWLELAGFGPMRTASADPAEVYRDVLFALAPERGINNGEPSLHMMCIARAAPRPGDAVVHVGAGTGYYTAILAELVGAQGRVDAYEIEADLAARARDALAPWPQVRVHAQSAVGCPLPRAGVFYVSAGASHLPSTWLDALAIGGRMVLPLTAASRGGCMLLVRRLGEHAHAAEIFAAVRFIPCVGAHDERAAESIAQALARGGESRVRSLHRGTPPDASAWCAGPGWWLGTAEPDEPSPLASVAAGARG